MNRFIIVALVALAANSVAFGDEAELRAIIAKQAQRIAALEKENAELKKRLGDVEPSEDQKKVIGRWKITGPGYGPISIELLPNLNFKETWKGGAITGEWKVEDGFLVLKGTKATGSMQLDGQPSWVRYHLDGSGNRLVVTPIRADGTEIKVDTMILTKP